MHIQKYMIQKYHSLNTAIDSSRASLMVLDKNVLFMYLFYEDLKQGHQSLPLHKLVSLSKIAFVDIMLPNLQ